MCALLPTVRFGQFRICSETFGRRLSQESPLAFTWYPRREHKRRSITSACLIFANVYNWLSMLLLTGGEIVLLTDRRLLAFCALSAGGSPYPRKSISLGRKWRRVFTRDARELRVSFCTLLRGLKSFG